MAKAKTKKRKSPGKKARKATTRRKTTTKRKAPRRTGTAAAGAARSAASAARSAADAAKRSQAKLDKLASSLQARLKKASRTFQKAKTTRRKQPRVKAARKAASPSIQRALGAPGKHAIAGNPHKRKKGQSAAQRAATKRNFAKLQAWRAEQGMATGSNPWVKTRPVAYTWRSGTGKGNVSGGTPMRRSPYKHLGAINPTFGVNQSNIELQTLATDALMGVVGATVAGVVQRFIVKDFVRVESGGATVIKRNPWAIIWHGLVGVGGGLALRQMANPTLRRLGTASAYTTLTYLLTRTAHDLTAKVKLLNPEKTLSDLPMVNRIPFIFGTAANKASVVTSHQAGALLAGTVSEAEKEALLNGAVTSEEADRLLGRGTVSGAVSEEEKERLLGAMYDGMHKGWD